MKKIVVCLVVAFTCLSSSYGQQTWASLTASQGISWGALQDAVNTGVLTQKTAIPSGAPYKLIERDSIAAYVALDTTNAGFAAKGNKQIINKSDITKGSVSYSISIYGIYNTAPTGAKYVWYSINDATMASPTRLTTNIGTTSTLAGTITATSAQTVYIAIGDITGVASGVDPFNYRIALSNDGTYPASFPTACNTAASSGTINFTPAYVYLKILNNGLACSEGTNVLGNALN